ncbi:MAG: glycoside hydrolase family 13 protein [Lachnospiraceae bacterium]|nr:glycoside hydrolase family 13 protein [Lachnospiraceae bacterium]
MNKCAVLHIPASQYAFAQLEDRFVVRLRAGKGDLDCCTLFYGDRACVSSPVRFASVDMERRYQDELYDFYEVTLEDCPRRICYYFELEKGNEKIYYYADSFHQELPDIIMEDGFVIEGRSEYYQYPYILRSEVVKLPEWFAHAVVYNIFPDSFADGRRSLAQKGKEITGTDGTLSRNRLGGTIRGIVENLDYIRDLGFNCLYLNPVFHAGEYHKYDIVDYFHIDPCMGTDEDFLQLTQAVHERGMHIIIDGVFNHCSWYFPQFEDVVQKGEQSVYRNWFYDVTYPVVRPETEDIEPGYACFAYERKMPKLNTSNPEVQDYFARVGSYWIEKFHVDGWRLDVANEVDKNFWRKFRNTVRAANPEAVLIGEVWENAEVWLKGDMFDSVMNYDFRKHCRDFFALRRTMADDFAWNMTDMFLRYPAQVSRGQLNLLDSHDVPRFYSLCGENYDRFQAAFLYLCMAPGVPSVFYGDEKRISGIREEEYRRGMPWAQSCGAEADFVRTVIEIRKKWIAPDDDYRVLWTDHKDNLLVFERVGVHCVRVLIHMGTSPADVQEYIGGTKILLQKGLEGSTIGYNGYAVVLEY